MGEEAAALSGIGQRDAAETAAVNPGDFVVPRQAFVDVGVIGAQQFADAAIFLERIGNEEFGFLLKGLQEAFVVIRVADGIDDDLGNAAKVQPLSGEIVGEGAGGARVGQHAADFFFEDLRFREFVGFGQIEKGFIGDAAPEKEGQTGGEFDGSEAIGIAVNAEEEVRVGEHSLEGELDAVVETAALFAAVIEEWKKGF